MPDSIKEAIDRCECQRLRCGVYIIAWFVFFIAMVGARAAGTISTPWPIVLMPLWGPPALRILWRLLFLVIGILGFIFGVLFL